MLKSPIINLSAAFVLVAVLFIRTVTAVPTTSAPASSTPATRPAPATHFIDLLATGDFTSAAATFDAAMKAALPADKLRDTWQTIEKQAGPFQKQLRTRTISQPPYTANIVTCQFEKASLDARVIINAQGQVSGLFFAPTPTDATAFKTPPYAKPDTCREKDFTVATPGWPLPGTLTTPAAHAAPLPAVILVHGSGPNDRDETIGTNKPFRDLAWGLATRGIAVVRYEKRTREHAAKLTGDAFAHLTVHQETIEDALTAAAQLRTTDGIDPARIYILGHSLGATLAPRIAAADPKLAGIIMLAPAARPIEDLMVEQTRYLLSLNNAPPAEQKAQFDPLLADVQKIKALTPTDANSAAPILGAPPAYWLDLRAHDPLATAKSLTLPMLLLQGARDYQVTQTDFDLWKKALADKPNVTLKLYPDLNHLFIPGTGKSTPAEYDLPANIAPSVINDIANWIDAQKLNH